MSKQLTSFSFVCPDEQVGEINRLLSRFRVLDLACRPLTNARASGQGIEAIHKGDLPEQFISFARERHAQTFRVPPVREFLAQMGHSEKSASALLSRLRLMRLIRANKVSNKKHANYTINDSHGGNK